jgi:hypothetical protein
VKFEFPTGYFFGGVFVNSREEKYRSSILKTWLGLSLDREMPSNCESRPIGLAFLAN